jgi:hypothetical protein
MAALAVPVMPPVLALLAVAAGEAPAEPVAVPVMVSVSMKHDNSDSVST